MKSRVVLTKTNRPGKRMKAEFQNKQYTLVQRGAQHTLIMVTKILKKIGSNDTKLMNPGINMTLQEPLQNMYFGLNLL